MNWSKNSATGLRGGIGTHSANILRHTLAEGKVKIYQDEQHTIEQMRIEVPKGTVVIHKEYMPDKLHSRYKKIEVFSLDEEPLGSLDILTDMELLHPTFRFYYGTSPIGRGSGDVGTYIAVKLLGDFADPRLTAGASVDPEVLQTLQKLIDRQTI